MQVIVLADDDKQKAGFLLKRRDKNVNVEFVNDYGGLLSYKNADALIILSGKIKISELPVITQPVFIHSVTATLRDLHLPDNVSRINAWPTFLQRDLWEVATKHEAGVKSLFNSIGWNCVVTPDEPGFIAARILAMIINEAYHTFDDGISSKEAIDVSMRLGANYPYGPFEWAEIIGVNNVCTLLKRLAQNDKRYTVSAAMEAEVKNSNE